MTASAVRRAGLLLSLALVVPTAPPVLAAPEDRAPTEQDVREAREAVADVEARVAELDARMLDYTAQLRQVEIEAQVAGEAAVAARVEAEEKQAEADRAARRAAEARAAADAANEVLGRHAASAYKAGGLGALGVLFSDGDAGEVLERAGALEVIARIRNRDVQEATSASGTAEALEREAALASAQAEAAALEAEEAEAAAQAAVARVEREGARLAAEREGTLAELARVRQVSVETERARQEHLQAEADRIAAEKEQARIAAELEAERRRQAVEAERQRAAEQAAAEEAAAREAEEAARPTQAPAPAPAPEPDPAPEPAPAPSPTPSPSPKPSPSPSPTPTPTPTPEPPPQPAPPPAPPAPAPGAQTAIAWAHTQVGKPYVWGATGPDAYDCSGFTMRAWRQAGVHIPQGSRLQYHSTAKVPVDQAQPGDLLFYSTNGSPSGIFHVAIYLGGGQVIHALRDWSSWDGVKVTGMHYSSGLLPYAGRP